MPFTCPDFDAAPLLVIWEITRSCSLACVHCRASAELGRHPDELTTAEGLKLVDDVAAMGTPILIFSGGDPLTRGDLEQFVARGKQRGLRVGTIPAASASLTRERLAGLAAAGLDQLALSLDAPTADHHDRLRGVAGSFARTLEGAGHARSLGLPLQINTCLSRANAGTLDEMARLVRSLGAVFWEVFLLVPIGRGARLGGLEPREIEEAFAKLADVEAEGGLVVKITEGQQYRRFLRRSARGRRAATRGTRARIHGGVTATPQAVNAGKGFLFVDHVGQICPSGFLPLPCGNVRTHALAEVYRESPVFVALRDPGLLEGKCGRCEFAEVCGGSRARAYALTGDLHAADPACEYKPRPMEVFA